MLETMFGGSWESDDETEDEESEEQSHEKGTLKVCSFHLHSRDYKHSAITLQSNQ